MILTRKLSQLHWPAAAISSRVYLIFADCIPIICCLKPHGTASFPRVCLPSHQAKFSGLRASFPGCPKGDSGPKVPLGASCDQKCAAQLLRGHQRVLVRLGSLQNWIVSTTWSNSKDIYPEMTTICGSMAPHVEEVIPMSFAISVWDKDWAQQVATTSCSHQGYSLHLLIPVPICCFVVTWSDMVGKRSQNDLQIHGLASWSSQQLSQDILHCKLHEVSRSKKQLTICWIGDNPSVVVILQLRELLGDVSMIGGKNLRVLLWYVFFSFLC